MLILSAEDVREALPMPVAIEAMKRAFAAFRRGEAVVPPRLRLDIEPHAGVKLVMPAYVGGDEKALSTKVATLFPRNPDRGLPFIHAAVIVFEPNTGRPLALMEGAALTAIRTGAASGAATDLLARPGAKTVAIFGAGAQAPAQLEAVCAVRKIETAWIYSWTPEKTEALIESLVGNGRFPTDIRRAGSPREAVADADIICTATASTDRPVFDDADLRPGVHINAVGSFQPQVAEIPPETIERSWVIVDSLDAVKEEAGDLIQPVEAGRIGWDHVRAELGELIVTGTKPARPENGQPTFFKSVGLAVQDAVASRVALENATIEGLGTEVPW